MQYVYSLLSFPIAEGAEKSPISVAVTYYFMDIDLKHADVVFLCLQKKKKCKWRSVRSPQ